MQPGYQTPLTERLFACFVQGRILPSTISTLFEETRAGRDHAMTLLGYPRSDYTIHQITVTKGTEVHAQWPTT